MAEARDTVIGQRDTLQQEVFTLTGERDGLRIHNGHLVAERDALQAEIRRLHGQLQPRAYLAHEYLRGEGLAGAEGQALLSSGWWRNPLLRGMTELLVGAPLWALAHLRIDGNGLPGETASNGYFLIFEIL